MVRFSNATLNTTKSVYFSYKLINIVLKHGLTRQIDLYKSRQLQLTYDTIEPQTRAVALNRKHTNQCLKPEQ